MEDINLPDILEFDWDEGNSTKSYIKHNVSVQEQEQAFFDNNKQVLKDNKHSGIEVRYLLLARTKKGRFLILAFTRRQERIRCISARQMNKKEVKFYEKSIEMA